MGQYNNEGCYFVVKNPLRLPISFNDMHHYDKVLVIGYNVEKINLNVFCESYISRMKIH